MKFKNPSSFTLLTHKESLMNKLIAASVAIAVTAAVSFAEVAPSGSAAVEFDKKSNPASSTNVDAAWVRVEPKLKGSLKSGVTGLVHLRFQANMGSGTTVNAQLRQGYFNIPVSILNIQAGRWYEIYTPGKYFGRYLNESSVATGTGSMLTNYTIMDGIDLSAKIDAAKMVLKLGLFPQDNQFESLRLRALVSATPVEALKVQLGGNFHVYDGTDDEVDQQRLALTAAYTILKDLGLGLFAEYGIRDLEEVAANSWIMAGLDIPTAKILDLLRFEMEFKNYKLANQNNSDDNANFAWMIILSKKVKMVSFDLNFGSDPRGLGSEKPGDVGAILRVTAGF